MLFVFIFCVKCKYKELVGIICSVRVCGRRREELERKLLRGSQIPTTCCFLYNLPPSHHHHHRDLHRHLQQHCHLQRSHAAITCLSSSTRSPLLIPLNGMGIDSFTGHWQESEHCSLNRAHGNQDTVKLELSQLMIVYKIE